MTCGTLCPFSAGTVRCFHFFAAVLTMKRYRHFFTFNEILSYLSGLYSATTSVVIPPRGLNCEVTFIQRGLQAFDKSFSMSFVKAS
jgi:hypothetical protein